MAVRPAQLLIRWNLQFGVVPLPKANHANHQRENLHVFDFEITQLDMAKLRTLNEHWSALGACNTSDAAQSSSDAAQSSHFTLSDGRSRGQF